MTVTTAAASTDQTDTAIRYASKMVAALKNENGGHVEVNILMVALAMVVSGVLRDVFDEDIAPGLQAFVTNVVNNLTTPTQH